MIIEAVLERHADACVRRIHAELIAAVGAGYADYAAGRADIHDFGFAADERYRSAAAESLGKGRYVRLHAVEACRAARTEAQTGDHLVHYHADALCVAYFAYAAHKLGFHHRAAHVKAYRLDDDGRDVALVFFNKLCNGFEII